MKLPNLINRIVGSGTMLLVVLFMADQHRVSATSVSHRIQGVAYLESSLISGVAPMSVEAYVTAPWMCGVGLIGADGSFDFDVVSDSLVPGCGTPGAPIKFSYRAGKADNAKRAIATETVTWTSGGNSITELHFPDVWQVLTGKVYVGNQVAPKDFSVAAIRLGCTLSGSGVVSAGEYSLRVPGEEHCTYFFGNLVSGIMGMAGMVFNILVGNPRGTIGLADETFVFIPGSTRSLDIHISPDQSWWTDINCDRDIDGLDALLVLRALATLSTEARQGMIDPDADGQLTIVDAVYVRRLAAGLDN